MTITEEKLKEIIEPQGNFVKESTISSDGKALLTRIPKGLVEELNIKKGDCLTWIFNGEGKEIKLVLNKQDGS